MNFNESIIYYLVIGAAIAVAYRLQDRNRGVALRSAACLAAWLFWPLYLPLLLSARNDRSAECSGAEPVSDDLARGIVQVQRELDAALAGLDGWAEGVLQQNCGRLRELGAALTVQADRIREMDALLAREQAEAGSPGATADVARPSHELDLTNSRFQRSRQARLENMARLAALSRQSRTDLVATLAWVRELVSMIHLAKYTGAPAARAEELVAQIAAAVEGISSLSRERNAAGSQPLSAANPIESRSVFEHEEQEHEPSIANP